MMGKDYFVVQKMFNLIQAACTSQDFPRAVKLHTVLSTGSVYNLAAPMVLICMVISQRMQVRPFPLAGIFIMLALPSLPGLNAGDGCQLEPLIARRSRGSGSEA